MFKNIFHANNLTKFNSILGLITLNFQIFVLYPWHNQLSLQMQNFENNIINNKSK